MSSSASRSRSSAVQQIFFVPYPLCGAEIITKICRGGSRPSVRSYMCCYYSDGVCHIFEWQQTYAAALENHQQLNQVAPPGAQALQLNPSQASPPGVQVLHGHPVQVAPPSHKSSLPPSPAHHQSLQMSIMPLSRYLQDQSCVAHIFRV